MDDIKSQASSAYEYSKSTFSGMDNNRKFIVLIAIVIAALVIFYIWRRMRQTAQQNEPLFLTSIDQNAPYEARNGNFTYTYNGITTPYIPTDRIPEISTENTYSFWIFIDPAQWSYRISEWKHVWHRGDDLSAQLKTAPPGGYESPGVWIAPQTNQMNFVFSTLQSRETAQGDAQPQNLYEQIVLEDVELNKWTNYTIVINQDNATLYKDGLMISNRAFRNPITVNKENLFITQLGGFGGKLAYLRFVPSAMNPSDVYQMFKSDKKQIDRYIEYVRTNSRSNRRTTGAGLLARIEGDICSDICKNRNNGTTRNTVVDSINGEIEQAKQAARDAVNAATYGKDSVPTPIADTSNATGTASDYSAGLTNLKDVKSYLTERTM